MRITRTWWCANRAVTVGCGPARPCSDDCEWVLVVPERRVDRSGIVWCESAQAVVNGYWDEAAGRWAHQWPDSRIDCAYEGHCAVWLVEGDPNG